MSQYQATSVLAPVQFDQFDTLQELEGLGYIQQAMSAPNFLRLSLFKLALMCEYTDAPAEAVAFLKNLQGLPWNLSSLGLPPWNPPPPVIS
jgi:hypothetical protein